MDVLIITFHEQIRGEVRKAFYIKGTLITVFYALGIQYFTFDALDAMLEHASTLNTIRNGVQVYTRMIPEIAEGLYRELQSINNVRLHL